ncbi:hypothetical protein HJG53_04065 [Sphingomonas sp. ID1715]|uniref:hypothetical protein n=1 Tax=Sphingomonas sp. ID1715 TaxID=1656898 RepID=UPI0014887EA2|nr:hypothetical protein [Sphingomonas sp. ID1715]NNM76083.1 hypothetical protein [Sphingomonas sp. ID1715]
MNPFEMVIGIVLIVTVGRIIQAKLGANRRFGPPGSVAAGSGESRRLREEILTLKERVAVLERLITDERGSRELEREIEALRSRDA